VVVVTVSFTHDFSHEKNEKKIGIVPEPYPDEISAAVNESVIDTASFLPGTSSGATITVEGKYLTMKINSLPADVPLHISLKNSKGSYSWEKEIRGEQIISIDDIQDKFLDFKVQNNAEKPTSFKIVIRDVPLNLFEKYDLQDNSLQFRPIVKLDKEAYNCRDKVHLTITDLPGNKDKHKDDIIGGKVDDGSIKIQTRNSMYDHVLLSEKWSDSGTFTGEFNLKCFVPFDANGDGGLNDLKGTISVVTFNEDLTVNSEDMLTVTYILEQRKFETSANIKWNMAEIQFVSTFSKDTPLLRVIDHDYDLDPESVDKIQVHVDSSSDPNGISMTLTETNSATGVFENGFFISSKYPNINGLQVHTGDTLKASFVDYTLPKPYTFDDSLEVTASLSIE
jgi:hypothetical protein